MKIIHEVYSRYDRENKKWLWAFEVMTTEHSIYDFESEAEAITAREEKLNDR